MSHSNHYYNNNLSIIYASTNAYDLLYETTIDSTIRYKSTHHTATANYSLHRMPSRWMKRQESDTIETTLNEESELETTLNEELIEHKENTIEKMEWDAVDVKTPSLEADLPSLSSEMVELTAQKSTLQNTHRFMNGNIEGFTLLQAVQYLLDSDIITTRGEGLDFLAILQDRRIIEPCIQCYMLTCSEL